MYIAETVFEVPIKFVKCWCVYLILIFFIWFDHLV